MHLSLDLPVTPRVLLCRANGSLIIAEIAHKLADLLRRARLSVLGPRIKCGHLTIPKHGGIAFTEGHQVVEFDMELSELVKACAFLH